MPFEVTSWFVEEAAQPNPAVVRKFYIDSNDYSDYVQRWPKLKRVWDEVRPVSVTINLNNTEQTFNFFHTDKTKLMGTGKLQFGFTHPTSGDELLTLFTGKIERVKLNGTTAAISTTDKTKPFSELQLGDNETPLDFTGSDYLPSDLAWYIVTSHGGFSAVANSSNLDIDYAAFANWAAVFSGDNVRVNARFEGMKITEALRKISRMTRSAIFIKDNKLSFHRFSLADSHQMELSYANMEKSPELTLDDKTVINKQYVLAAYDQSSDYHTITTFDVATASVNSYGQREQTEEDKSIWYVDSIGALNLAQRIINVSKDPFSDYSITAKISAAIRQVGETILLTDAFFGEGGSAYRIMSTEIDMQSGLVKIGCNATQILASFTLDYSTLDGTDVLI